MQPLHKRYPTTANKGLAGEAWMRSQLERHYEVVNDYTLDMDMQLRGIDFSIQRSGWRREYYLDVKNNLYVDKQTGNISLNLEITKANNAIGWFLTSQADRIYHVNTYVGKYLYYDLPTMRRWVIRELYNKRLNIFKTEDGSELIRILNTECPILIHNI